MSDQRVSKIVDEAHTLESKSDSPVEIDKTLLEDIIGTVNQNENLTEPLDTHTNHVTTEKTNEVDNSDQTNSKKSRELKLLLALSKEANLDTNILHKRNSLEGNKAKVKDLSKTTGTPSDSETKKIPKVAHENRNIRYPVTAESELELDAAKDDKKNLIDTSHKPSKRKRDELVEVSIGGATEESNKKNKKPPSDMARFKQNKDIFCWRCHREAVNITCETCPRSYHQKCLKQTINDTEHWPCPECVSILKAESTQTRSAAMKGMTLEHLCSLLKFAVNRMIQCQGSEPFLHPVSDAEFPDYKKYIVQPMDLTKMEKNIKGNLYGSTQAFEADAKWLLHNSIIYNSYQSKLTTAAKSIIKICKQEMAEIENCPSCYLNANTKKDTWFVEVCPKPHLLVWAKLKGFPFWPAKAMCSNSAGMVDVRFFGAHDRAWVHYKECYLFSEKDPNTFKQKRYDIEKCIAELNIYIANLKKIYGEFRYAPFKTVLEPDNEIKQLQIFLPKYKTGMSRKKSINKLENFGMKVNTMDEKKVKKVFSDNSESKNEKKNILSEKKENDAENKAELPSQQNLPEIKKTLDPKHDINQNGAELNINGCDTVYSKFNDDAIMEGYGTDDDTTTDIDLERRKHFIEKNGDTVTEIGDKVTEKNEETTQEEDEEDDTQVPSNIAADSSHVNELDKKGEENTVKNNTQILTRRASVSNLKQNDDLIPSPPKVARRNSDMNLKSDSNLMPNISEKINIVDISENMEITLGNDDVACISISENISSNSSDSEVSKACSEQSKRKPVQVDIENAEFTISPTNKLKISDTLIKRLSDSDTTSEVTNAKIEDAKKSIVGKKSPTDILIEKFSKVVDHEIVDFGHPSTSSTEEAEMPLEPSPNIDCNTAEDTCLSAENSTADQSSSNEEMPTITDLADPELQIKHTEDTVIETNKGKDGEYTESNNHTKQDVIEEKHHEVLTKAELKHYDTIVEEVKDSSQTADNKPTKKQKSLIQPSITEFTISSTSTRVTNEKVNSNETENATVATSDTCKSPQNSEPMDVVNIIEEFEETGEMEALNDIQIDKNNIFNIIHSSLNESKSNKDTNKTGNVVNDDTKKDNGVHEENSKVVSILSRKRKSSSDENSPSQSKQVKLVPIEDILNRPREKETSDSPLLQRSLQAKKMICKPSSCSSTPVSSASGQSSTQVITAEDIKSEPETDDDFSESENLEAKRKYLSALNISEKINSSDRKQSGNAIRTRSKTEEKREKFKKLDNLSRIIDDVALNYSTNVEKRGTPMEKHDLRRVTTTTSEGEIFVKSFAKMTPYKPRARKSFPTPTYMKPIVHSKPNNQVSLLRSESFSNNPTPKKDIPRAIVTTSSKVILNNSVVTTSQPQQVIEPGNSTLSHVIILPPNQSISYNPFNPLLTVVTASGNSSPPPLTHQLHKTLPTVPNVASSQNYIPQQEARNDNGTSDTAGSHSLNQSVTARREHDQPQVTENNPNPASTEAGQEEEFTVLNSLLPESVNKAVSDLLLRAPPRLKPRPPGPLSTVFDKGVPSSAGTVTSKINSVAHRLGDYFRGMLIETLEDLGKSSTPEAKITSLQLEIESLKHNHDVEMSEIRKNICTILKDIQKSIVEDRERIVDETRAACEVETIKRVELAKSKQWCANCTKEAQFYCCWNTSYCDYPCQQKHWPLHVGKCTQNIEKSNNITTTSSRPTGQQLILRPTGPPKPGMGRIVAKPTKVYMNRTVGASKAFKTLTTGNHLTVIETTPGNYELVGNGPIAVSGKLVATNSNLFHQKFKNANLVTVTSPSTSGNIDQRIVQRISSGSESSNTVASVASSSVTTVLDDDSD